MTRTPNYFLFALSYFFFSYTNIFSRISPKNTTMLKMTINAEVLEVFKPRTDKTIIKNRVTNILSIQITYKVAIDMFNMMHITKIHPNSLMLFMKITDFTHLAFTINSRYICCNMFSGT